MTEKLLLHVGCGPTTKKNTLPYFFGDEWREIRFDIDPAVRPDVTGSMTDMSAVPSESVDAVFSSHNLEHLYAHEVVTALREFLRVLKPDGFAVITCPDIRLICQLVADGQLYEPAYVSAEGPISPHDILFGHFASMAKGNLYMAHRSGFTLEALFQRLREAGFEGCAGRSDSPRYALWAVARKRLSSWPELQALTQKVLDLP